MWCPTCGAEYEQGVWACADDGTTLVASKPAILASQEDPVPRRRGGPLVIPNEVARHSHDEIKTAMLGRFPPLEIPIILQMLEEEGIFAMTKMPSDQPSRGGGYNFLPTGSDEIIVEAACMETARHLIKEKLPEIEKAMERELEQEFGDSE